MDHPKFLDPYTDVRITRTRLPHWQQKGASYFITFRLADSVPIRLLEEWEHERFTWLKFHPEPWVPEVEVEFYRRFPGRLERYLDTGHGSCVLRQSECSEIVMGALRHFDGERCQLHSAVIMPNHVHLCVAEAGEWRLDQLIHSWKRFTARRINEVLGRRGTLWMPDYFDRLIRDEAHFYRVIRYVRDNPRKAKLGEGACRLYESELARQVE